MKKIFLLIIGVLLMGCASRLVSYQEKNGLMLEKVNVTLINKLIKKKYRTGRYGTHDGIKTIDITEKFEDTVIVISAATKNDTFITIDKKTVYGNLESWQEFFNNGRLKLRKTTMQQKTFELEDVGVVNISPFNIGKLQNFDIDGKLLLEINYDSLFTYQFDDVKKFIIKDNIDKKQSYSIGTLYLSDKLHYDFNKEVKERLLNEGIKVEFNHPYWNVSSRENNVVKLTYIDGKTGNIIGENSFTVLQAHH